MRLKDKHIVQIRKIARNIYGKDVNVYLFGSRTNDNSRGGDIDLLIESPETEKMNFENKVKFLTDLKLNIGDQKIDVVYNKNGKGRTSKSGSKEDQKMGIITKALNTGVRL